MVPLLNKLLSARLLGRRYHSRRGGMAYFSASAAADFSDALSKASKVTVLTGAGISAESGIPTFRGEGGLWRTWNATELATPEAFAANPSLVWEFYHYRRVVVSNCKPNTGHYAITALQHLCEQKRKVFTLLTQNIDGLHQTAGSKTVELHGSLWKTRCCTCNDVQENCRMPICEALEGKGAADINASDAQIPTMKLPRCKKCNGLLRPHVVWFGESLFPEVLQEAYDALDHCDLLLVVGTSAVVQPAAGFAPIVKAGGGAVAEFNLEDTPISGYCSFRFSGKSGETLVRALGLREEDINVYRSKLEL